MFLILNFCQDSGILKTILLIKNLLKLVLAFIPLILIVVISLDVFKFVISGEKEKSNVIKRNINRLISSIIIYFIPTIISTVLTLVNTNNDDLIKDTKACFLNANSETIKDLEYQEKKLREEKKRQIEIEKKKNSYLNNHNKESNDSKFESLADEMISIAEGELENTDGTKYGINGPWCAAFLYWVGNNSTINNTTLMSDIIEKNGRINNPYGVVSYVYHFHNTPGLKFYYSNHYGGNYTPKKGDIIMFDWSGNWDKKITNNMSGSSKHIGIVESYSNGVIHTIEGNHGKRVSRVDRRIEGKSIMGFGSWYR